MNLNYLHEIGNCFEDFFFKLPRDNIFLRKSEVYMKSKIDCILKLEEKCLFGWCNNKQLEKILRWRGTWNDVIVGNFKVNFSLDVT
jgi:hypothetical protein